MSRTVPLHLDDRIEDYAATLARIPNVTEAEAEALLRQVETEMKGAFDPVDSPRGRSGT